MNPIQNSPEGIENAAILPVRKRRGAIAMWPLVVPNPFIADFADSLRDLGHEVTDYDSSLRALLRTKVAIFHWPNAFFNRAGRIKAMRHLGRMLIAKLFGTRFIWVAHNLYPHERNELTPVLTDCFLRMIDGIIYLSEHSKQAVCEAYPTARNKASLVTVHGRYADVTDAQDCSSIPADRPVRLCSFGQVRPYKNWHLLIAAAAQGDGEKFHLVLRGRHEAGDYCAGLVEQAKGARNIDLELTEDFLSVPDLEAHIDASDGVVLPYRDILNSGSAVQALSRNRPVLVPAIGSMPELQVQVGSQWVYLYHGELDLAVLERFAVSLRNDKREARPDLSLFGWDRIGTDLRRFVGAVGNLAG